jgi:hypothetical protein
MTSDIPDERPNCEEILENINDWAFNMVEVVIGLRPIDIADVLMNITYDQNSTNQQLVMQYLKINIFTDFIRLCVSE